jgi:hypothetical protein
VSAALIRPHRNYSDSLGLKLTCAAFARHTGECAEGLRNGSWPMNDDANSSAPYLRGRPSVPLTNEDDDHGRKDQSRSEGGVVSQDAGEYIIRMFVILTYPGFDQHRGWLIQSRKGTVATYRAASARTKGLAGAMSGGKQ